MEKIIGIWKHAEKVKNKIVQKLKKIKYEQKKFNVLMHSKKWYACTFCTYVLTFFLKGSRLSAKYWLSNMETSVICQTLYHFSVHVTTFIQMINSFWNHIKYLSINKVHNIHQFRILNSQIPNLNFLYWFINVLFFKQKLAFT